RQAGRQMRAAGRRIGLPAGGAAGRLPRRPGAAQRAARRRGAPRRRPRDYLGLSGLRMGRGVPLRDALRFADDSGRLGRARHSARLRRASARRIGPAPVPGLREPGTATAIALRFVIFPRFGPYNTPADPPQAAGLLVYFLFLRSWSCCPLSKTRWY